MRLTIALAMFSLALSAAATPLSEAAASMRAGEWLEFSTTGFNWDLIYRDVNNETGSTPNTAFGDRLTWDPGTRTIPFLGLGHYRAWKFMHYTDETNAWAGDTNLPDTCMFTGGSCICHPYNNGTVNTDSSIFYFMQCSEAWDPQLNKLYRYDIRAASWTVIPVPSGYNMSYGYCLTYFPALNSLIQLKQSSLNRLDLATGGWSHVTVPAPGIPDVSYHQCMTLSALKRKMVFGGGQLYRDPGPDSNFSYMFVMDSAGSVSRLPDAPTPYAVEATTLTSDPVTGDILLVGWDDELYSLDLDTREWTHQAGRKPPFTEQALATAVPDYGVTLFMVPDILKTYLYKHAESSPVEVLNRSRAAGLAVLPNPFNPSAAIHYHLGRGMQGKLAVFSADGRRVREWPLHSSRGRVTLEKDGLAPGVYFCRLTGPNGLIRVQKAMLIR